MYFMSVFFFNCESMITHLQETWKIQNKVMYGSIIYYIIYYILQLSRYIKIFSWSFNIKLFKNLVI